MLRWLLLLGSHTGMLALGFALGIYVLPILIAPESPDQAELSAAAEGAQYEVTLTRDLKGSDFLHWGEGTISLMPRRIVHEGALSPGPDYKLYLVPEYVEDEAGFEAVRDGAVQIGDIKSFDGFIADVPDTVRLEDYTTVLIWCESFSEFITAAKYR